MITGESDWLKKIAETNVCYEHEQELTVAWDDKQAVHYLRCGQGHPATGLRRKMTATEEFKNTPGEKALSTPSFLPAKDLGSNQELTEYQVLALVSYAKQYGLDAYRGHVCLMYGKPYIQLDGYLYHAKQTKEPYHLGSRPMTPTERTAYQLLEGDHGWISEITKIVNNAYFIGIGIVTKEELEAKSDKNPNQLRSPVVAKHPQLLAQKRAEWQALRRAFPIGEE
jgi:hypothetical protein